MKIELTNIPDINLENIDEAKVGLANKIISNIKPLFNDVSISKNRNIKKLKEDFKNKRNSVKKRKIELEGKLEHLNTRKKVKKLLERIDKLQTFGLLYEGEFRREMIIILKVIDKLEENKIDLYLKETMDIVNKRFSR